MKLQEYVFTNKCLTDYIMQNYYTVDMLTSEEIRKKFMEDQTQIDLFRIRNKEQNIANLAILKTAADVNKIKLPEQVAPYKEASTYKEL